MVEPNNLKLAEWLLRELQEWLAYHGLEYIRVRKK